jgi:hypothetical protein
MRFSKYHYPNLIFKSYFLHQAVGKSAWFGGLGPKVVVFSALVKF